MNEKQRAQVVELLRCAAKRDGSLVAVLVDTDHANTLTDEQCSVLGDVYYRAYHAKPFQERNRVEACLLAAQRVEEGNWP